MKKLEWFESVQVVERVPAPDACLKKWYDGDQFASPGEARAATHKNRKEFPDTEFVTIKKTVEEL